MLNLSDIFWSFNPFCSTSSCAWTSQVVSSNLDGCRAPEQGKIFRIKGLQPSTCRILARVGGPSEKYNLDIVQGSNVLQSLVSLSKTSWGKDLKTLISCQCRVGPMSWQKLSETFSCSWSPFDSTSSMLDPAKLCAAILNKGHGEA